MLRGVLALIKQGVESKYLQIELLRGVIALMEQRSQSQAQQESTAAAQDPPHQKYTPGNDDTFTAAHIQRQQTSVLPNDQDIQPHKRPAEAVREFNPAVQRSQSHLEPAPGMEVHAPLPVSSYSRGCNLS